NAKVIISDPNRLLKTNMIFSMAVGHFGSDAGGHHGGAHDAFDGHVHGLLGHGGHGAHGFGDHGGHGGHSGHESHGHGSNNGHDDAPTDQLKALSKTGNIDIHTRQKTSLLMLFMSWASPTSMAIFLGFFGVTGMAIYKLGLISLIPAILAGFIMRNVTMMMLRWFVQHSHVSTTTRVEEAIGYEALVCVSIQPGKTGEITYVLGSKRYNMPAKSETADHEFKRGSKVMISDIREGVVFVQPWQEITIS
ncbi:MAG: hypothetical protein IAF58_14585, partial [Leptolyngbya sp.]|nr:hypothetical protein [Candidatus Melainabacteria bacterium]